MKRSIGALLACALLVGACSGGDTKPTPAATLTDIGEGLEGPASVKASIYAAGLVHAAAFAFDELQRLWVATADYSDSGQDAVYVVEPGGAATVKAITGVHTPLGLLSYGDTLYVASKDVVEAYRTFDGTTFATHDTVVAFPTGVGEVNGLALSPDGRIQLGISAPCDHCTPTIEYSGAIVSFLPDGSDLRVDAKGIRAPIALTYAPGTDDLFVTMNQRDDLGDATPGDWLAVVQPGESWGFPDCYGQAGTACNGVPAPVAELDKHAALSGVAIVSGRLAAALGTVAVVAEWSTGSVQQVTLTKTGSTYTGTASPFVTGMKNPVGVILGPDDALYISDWTTGTIYRIASA